MLFGVREGDFVADGCVSGGGKEEREAKEEYPKQIPRFADSARNDKFILVRTTAKRRRSRGLVFAFAVAGSLALRYRTGWPI